MSSARVWKTLASVAGACGLLLTAAGVPAAGAAPSAPSREKDPPIDCATAEHVGIGAPYHALHDCSKPYS